MDKTTTATSTKKKNNHNKQLTDKKIINDLETNSLKESNEEECNKLDDNKIKLNKNKLDEFINDVKDENKREIYFNKLDKHVNNLLDSVKLKEKKRKNAKIIPSTESNGLDKIDLTSSDSILTQINLKNVFNINTFNSLPLYYQYKLIKLLPKCDQDLTDNGWLKLNESALNNEYFTKANQFWLKQLKESKLNSDFIQKCKTDLEKEKQRLDPFKIKNFEPIWNEPLNSKINYENLIDKERENKLNLKKEKDKATKDLKDNLNDFNLKLNEYLESNEYNNLNSNNKVNNLKNDHLSLNTNQSKNNSKPKTSINKKRPAKQNTKTPRTKKSNSQTPLKNQSQIDLNNSSPVSISSITVSRKSVESSPISLNNTLNNSNQSQLLQQSPTSGKLFYISNCGKLLQIVSPIDNNQNGRKPELQSIQTENIKRKLNLEGINNTKQLVNDKKFECDENPLLNCSICFAYCHIDCLNNYNICDNCVKK